ncbi:DUF1648 domain-containing protein [Nocardioides sambongensis]|uniref:DUF1648 domain-containing protein n=1 Tax=Nocardioides sambongensis TaxID=2589074 RepID=UPI0015E86E5E|nr:DUF1648 domain-containing protein [Nocardioides sambongensis]
MTPPPDPGPARPDRPGSGASRAVFIGSCLAYAAAWVLACVRLPDRVPLHFGGGGDVDRWGGRTEALVTFAVLGLAMIALFAGLAAVRVPTSMLNVPHKEWWTATTEREERMRTMMREDGLRLGAATLLLLTAVLLLTVRAAGLAEPRLDGWFAVALGLYLAYLAGFTLHAFRVRYRHD